MAEKHTSPLPLTHVTNNYSSKIELAYNGSREDLDPYIPADHRPKDTSTSTVGALAHLLKASLGSGILAMPLAFKNAGLLVGLVGTLLIGLLCAHVIHILVKTSQHVSAEMKKPYLGYAETCDYVFQLGPKPVRKYATFIRELTEWSIAVTHVGVCCVYVVVIAESFKQVSDVYNGPEWSLRVFCALTLVVLIPITQITKLKYLVPFSTMANFVWLGSICISLYYCLRNTPEISERNLVNSFSGIPNFVTTCLFAMEGIGVVMPIENEMAKPHHFLGCPGVLNMAMIAIILCYGFVGFIGYGSYGDDVKGSLTLNLPEDEVLAQAAKLLVSCVMLLSYALLYYVPVEAVWKRSQDKVPAKYHRWVVAALRLTGTLITVSIACAIPKIELFMELVGAICLSVMGLIIPVTIETVWRWDKDLGPFKWIIWKNSIICLLAIMALITGVTYSIKSLFDQM